MRENLLLYVSSLLIIGVLILLHCKMNCTKMKRSRQIVLPLFAVLFDIVIISLLYVKYDNVISVVFDICTSFLSRFSIDMSSADIPIINIIIYVIYLVVRLIPGVLIWFIFQKEIFFKRFASQFYVYDPIAGAWLLKNKWQSTRDYMRIFMTITAVISAFSFTVLIKGGQGNSFRSMFLPTVVLLVITEIYNFFNGMTELEYERTVGGEDSYAEKIRSFYKLKEAYEKIFPHDLLVSDINCDYTSDKSVKELLESLSESEDAIDRKVGEFFRLNGENDLHDADAIVAVTKMLKGDNVIFFNPFYRDLGEYIILPVLYSLLSGKKCLIIVGRNSAKADIVDWMRDMLTEYGKVESLWRTRELDFKDPECEVGVISFSQIYDSNVLSANADFFSEVGFVFILEASLIINTGQIALSIIGSMMERNGEAPVYCVADRMVDGLVDSLSHIFQTQITEVIAPPIPKNIYTFMSWNADGDFLRQKLFDRQTKYLGNGFELAAVAVKNQIPKATWVSESKTPIKDMKWVVGQYYPTICKYMNIPTQQESIYEHIEFVDNLWGIKKKNDSLIVSDDEFFNMFSTIRTYLSRGSDQTFVNVISENYLLRDYMRCNPQMFATNPDAINSIAPEYSKTTRNTLIKLLIMMADREVSEHEIFREFSLAGVDDNDALRIMTTLLKKYFSMDNSIFKVRTVKDATDDNFLGEANLYSILPAVFREKFGETLANAYYICEDEEKKEYVDCRLFGNIAQVILPGQEVAYGGKYYVVHMISKVSGVILRRATNLLTGRKYYRQIRNYVFSPIEDSDVISDRIVMDVEIKKVEADFKVQTSGYLELKRNDDLRGARLVDISKDPSVGSYERKYNKKSVLMIKLPDTSDRIRFTVSMLLNELFKTFYPDGWHYLSCASTMPDGVDGILNYMVYGISGEYEPDYIYIIEDSDMDLGLLESVEKNLLKYLEILTDYLGWHFEKMREPAFSDPEAVTPEFPKVDYKRRKKFTDLFKNIRNLFNNFGGKKTEADGSTASTVEPEEITVKNQPDVKEIDTSTDCEPFDYSEETPDENDIREEAQYSWENEGWKSINHDEAPVKPKSEGLAEKETEMDEESATHSTEIKEDESIEPSEGDPDIVAIDGTDIFDEQGTNEDNEYFEGCFEDMGIISLDKSRYQKECFLRFGFDEIDARLHIDDVHKYLTVRGFSDNSYRKARTRNLFEETLIDIDAVNCCDFCGLPISGVSYERLSDGRIRCNDCSSSAINSVEEFRKIFRQTYGLVESFFGIKIDGNLKIKTVDAKKIARGYGSVYQPSTEMVSRVVGFAERKGNDFYINVENGSPRLATINTIVHELTHIWQYKTWDEKKIRAQYPDPLQIDIVYEGMAVWVAIQYLYLIGEITYARKEELTWIKKQDAYGLGLKMYSEKYPFVRDSSVVRHTPFDELPPL